jgi:hypothetical protein
MKSDHSDRKKRLRQTLRVCRGQGVQRALTLSLLHNNHSKNELQANPQKQRRCDRCQLSRLSRMSLALSPRISLGLIYFIPVLPVVFKTLLRVNFHRGYSRGATGYREKRDW